MKVSCGHQQQVILSPVSPLLMGGDTTGIPALYNKKKDKRLLLLT